MNYERIISLLQNVEEENVDSLLWNTPDNSINYLPAFRKKILEFNKPAETNNALSILMISKEEKYELLIFSVPWADHEIKYAPLLFEAASEKIIGIMMPFNELYLHFSNEEKRRIQNLTEFWMKFILAQQFPDSELGIEFKKLHAKYFPLES